MATRSCRLDARCREHHCTITTASDSPSNDIQRIDADTSESGFVKVIQENTESSDRDDKAVEVTDDELVNLPISGSAGSATPASLLMRRLALGA